MTAWTLEGIGTAESLQGKNEASRKTLIRALELFETVGDRGGSLFIVRRLGMAARRQDDHDRASRLLSAFSTLNAELLVGDLTQVSPYPDDVVAATREYQQRDDVPWREGAAMSYEAVIEYLLES